MLIRYLTFSSSGLLVVLTLFAGIQPSQASPRPSAPPPNAPYEIEGNAKGYDLGTWYEPPSDARDKSAARRPTAEDAPASAECPVRDPISGQCLFAAGSVGGGAATPVGLALEARGRLTVPVPVPQMRPMIKFKDGTSGGLTGMPMWLWTDPARWAPAPPMTLRVQAGPVWAAVAAAPVRQTWEFGDGGTLTCLTPGTPLTNPARGLDGSPDCGHKYRKSSKDGRRGAFTVTVRVIWAVTWTGSDGNGGTLAPLVVEASVPYIVRQARAELVRP